MTYDVVFVVASALAILSALGVVLSANPFYSALSLIGNLVSLAAMYLLLQSDFVAAAQVIVYAGAVMIMFLFVIAYLGGRAEEPVRSRPWYQTVGAIIAAVAIVAEVGFAVEEQAFGNGASVSDAFGAPQVIGASFLGRYVLTFEATSVLLLIAAVGGVTLGARAPARREAGVVGAFEVERPEPAISLQAEVVDAETRFDVVRAGGKDGKSG
jgi:NADH:ubiquinone oxidoreductase subunit 6 (subunit J)